MAAAALRVPLALPACAGCAGGGEVNGVECRECGGSTRAGGRRRRAWRSLARRPLLAVAGVAGTVVGWSRTLPGIGGAAGITFGVSAIVHSAWHWVPAYAVATLVGGAFALLMDRQIS